MTVLWDWCASPSATANLPFRSPQANWKAECDESRPLRLEGGKDCKVLPILTYARRALIEFDALPFTVGIEHLQRTRGAAFAFGKARDAIGRFQLDDEIARGTRIIGKLGGQSDDVGNLGEPIRCIV